MLVGIFGIFAFFVPLGWIIALILGFVARSEIKRSDGRLTGERQALAGIILGFISPAVYATMIVAFLTIGDLESSRSIDALVAGECVDYSGVNNENADFLSPFATLRSCNEPHDAEVLLVFEADGLAALSDDDAFVLTASRCEPLYEQATGESLVAPGGYDLTLVWLDDTAVCLVVDETGSKLQAPIRGT